MKLVDGGINLCYVKWNAHVIWGQKITMTFEPSPLTLPRASIVTEGSLKTLTSITIRVGYWLFQNHKPHFFEGRFSLRLAWPVSMHRSGTRTPWVW